MRATRPLVYGCVNSKETTFEPFKSGPGPKDPTLTLNQIGGLIVGLVGGWAGIGRHNPLRIHLHPIAITSGLPRAANA